MLGRRVDGVGDLELPGDYYRGEYADGSDSVLFLPPHVATRIGTPLYRVSSPPHTFRECDDGSIEVRASIVCHADSGGRVPYWHGYLDEGHEWRAA